MVPRLRPVVVTAVGSILAAAVCFPTPALAGGYPSPSASPPVPEALVTLESVSNGCGGGVASNEYKYGDDSTFVNSNIPFSGEKQYHVDFREACKLHDAGYSGAEVYDPLNDGYYDFFNWTKSEIDAKFLNDMRTICDQVIPESATIALHSCHWQGGYHSVSGAYTRYLIVKAAGKLFFNQRPELRGLWVNPADPNSTPWAIIQTGRTVKAQWNGGNGNFTGTLITRDQDSIVKGTMEVVKGSVHLTGSMSLTISNKNLDVIELNYQESNGVSVSAKLVRQ
ncbi:MAG: hypothetical protein ACHQBP_00185 [Acidimicrobiales bacterium]